MIKQVLVAGIILSATMASTPAIAAKCAKRDTVIERLQSLYSESLTGGGLQATASAQTLVEVWASKETGTFTVILTTPDGLACVMATGTDWFETTDETVAGTQS